MEIMIAVAIIAILAAGAYFGMAAVNRNARENQTKALLGTARSVVNEYAVGTRMNSSASMWEWDKTPGGAVETVDTTAGDAGLALNLMTVQWRYNSNTIPGLDPADAPEFMPAPRTTGDSWQLRNTRDAIRQLRRLPAAARLIGALPKDAVESSGNPPLLLDGFGQPLLYVHSGGLGNRTPGAGPNPPGSSAGAYADGTVMVGGQPTLILSPDGKPFWASAGYDGNFESGDDNLYSFEN